MDSPIQEETVIRTPLINDSGVSKYHSVDSQQNRRYHRTDQFSPSLIFR